VDGLDLLDRATFIGFAAFSCNGIRFGSSGTFLASEIGAVGRFKVPESPEKAGTFCDPKSGAASACVTLAFVGVSNWKAGTVLTDLDPNADANFEIVIVSESSEV